MISKWKRVFLTYEAEFFQTKAPDEEAEKWEKAMIEKISYDGQKNWTGI
jgi:hypothetical protein